MIKLKNINKSFSTDFTKLHVLKGIDLHIKEGDFVSIMGSSGSGKSTLLNIIGALDDPKVFYDAASDEELKKNLDQMMTSCDRFLDMGPLEFTHMSEYYLG